MKRHTCRSLCLVAFALCSIGAKDCATPARPDGGYQPNFYCFTDPPVGCAAYCSGPDTVTFTFACSHISGDALEKQFQDKVMQLANDAAAQGIHFCPEADLTKFLTPCAVDIIPVEWPNQDHAVCTPAPPGCPL
jgi:hypothetical protein